MGLHQLLLTKTQPVQSKCANTHIFPDTFMECQRPPRKSLGSHLPKKKHCSHFAQAPSRDLSSVTLPNWETVRFPTAGHENTAQGGAGSPSSPSEETPCLTPRGHPSRERSIPSWSELPVPSPPDQRRRLGSQHPGPASRLKQSRSLGEAQANLPQSD